MSGIAVIHDATGAPVPAPDIERLVGAISHRGVQTLTWSAPGIGLGQRLLPTTPEAAAESLPVTLAGGRFQIALDGRLDNRADLLAALGLGSDARLTDAGLIVLAYESWGDACLPRLVGDFAFALWDTTCRRLLVARDQRGFRPLVYARAGGRVLLGSEPRQLLASPDVPRTIDARFLACHLTAACPPPGSTPYASVNEVPPGHYLVIEGRDLREQAYWRPRPGPLLRYRRREEYVEHFEAVFGEATAALTRSTGAPAVLLSGGLDSSYVMARALETAPAAYGVHAFVAGTQGMDEREHARSVGEHLGARVEEFDVSDCWSLSGRYLPAAAYDQPNLPMQAALMVRMALATAESGAGVLIDGIGGDEFLTGDSSYIPELLLHGRPRRAIAEASAWSREIGMSTAQLLWTTTALPLLPLVLRNRFRALRGRAAPNPSPPWIDDFALRAIGLEAAVPRPAASLSLSRRAENALFWSQHERDALPVLGWRERNASLPSGVEARSPFWDLRVIEFLWSVPGWVHRSGGEGKALLRAAMRPRLPGQVVERPDKGYFDELMNVGLLEQETERVEAAIRGPLAALLYVRPAALEEELARYRQKQHPWWHALWRAVTGGVWLLEEEEARQMRASNGLAPRVLERLT